MREPASQTCDSHAVCIAARDGTPTSSATAADDSASARCAFTAAGEHAGSGDPLTGSGTSNAGASSRDHTACGSPACDGPACDNAACSPARGNPAHGSPAHGSPARDDAARDRDRDLAR